MASLFATAGSLSICAARDMVEIGVLNSCVMLLMKSFLISDNRFWRRIVYMVNMKITNSTNVKMIAGNMNCTFVKIKF